MNKKEKMKLQNEIKKCNSEMLHILTIAVG